MQRNVNRRRLAGRLAFFDAWRQVIEVVLIACPMDLLAGDQRIALLFEIIQDLLLKVRLYLYLWILHGPWPIAGVSAFHAVPHVVLLVFMAAMRPCVLMSWPVVRRMP